MSNFEFVFFVSLLYSTSRNRSSNSTSRNRSSNSTSRISIFDSNVEFKFLEFSSRICRRNFRCLALFDFSNFDSNLSSKFSLLYSTSRSSTSRSSTSRVKSLEFRIRLDLFDFSNFDSNSSSKFSIRICRRNFRFEFVVEIVVFVSHSSFEFLIELFNFRRNFDSRAQLLC